MASGAIVLKKYPDATMIGYDYGQPIPYDQIPRNQPVIMVDVSLPMDEMVKMAMHSGRQFTWIDHHQSAISDYEQLKKDSPTQAGYITTHLLQGFAACELTWNYFFIEFPMPEAVHLLGQYDTWRNQNQTNWNMLVVPFQYGMKVFGIADAKEFPQFLLKSNYNISQIITEGAIALKYQQNIDAQNMQNSFELQFEGLKAICCNGAGLGSMAFDSVWDDSKYDLMMPFKFDGNNWSFSLYTTKDIDCSVLAQKYGGGGHAKASGFISKTIPAFLSQHISE